MTVPSGTRAELSQWLAAAEHRIDHLVDDYRQCRDELGEAEAIALYWTQARLRPHAQLAEMLVAAISRLARTEVPGGEPR